MSEQWWVIGYPLGFLVATLLWFGMLFVVRKGWRTQGWWYR